MHAQLPREQRSGVHTARARAGQIHLLEQHNIGRELEEVGHDARQPSAQSCEHAHTRSLRTSIAQRRVPSAHLHVELHDTKGAFTRLGVLSRASAWQRHVAARAYLHALPRQGTATRRTGASVQLSER